MNEAWESLGRAADLQRRLGTIGRRMVPGSLAGSTETASLPSPLPTSLNHSQLPASSLALTARFGVDITSADAGSTVLCNLYEDYNYTDGLITLDPTHRSGGDASSSPNSLVASRDCIVHIDAGFTVTGVVGPVRLYIEGLATPGMLAGSGLFNPAGDGLGLAVATTAPVKPSAFGFIGLSVQFDDPAYEPAEPDDGWMEVTWVRDL